MTRQPERREETVTVFMCSRESKAMTETHSPEPGDTHTCQRTFTHEDVERFGEISGDQQAIHTDPDEDGRLVVQGLLTATLSTKIGGDLEVLATRMEFNYRRPVYTGQTITCVWKNESVTERDDRYELFVTLSCTNDDGVEVLSGETEGIIWKDDPGE